LAFVGAASDPAERMADPAQEAHARAVFTQVRCVVCQNQSIDDSEAPLAHDLRMAIRRQIAEGRSDAQIRGFLVARYGEFILMTPRFTLGNSPLWLAPFAILLIAAVLFGRRLLRPAALPEQPELSADEQARLRDLGADGWG
jgi:cytochrome c-type biogenesis protein CcmH